MELETSRFLLGLLFLIIGIALFAAAIVIRLRMEKELIGERRALQNCHFPCWNPDGFSDRGNIFRKIYNVIYFALILYSIALIIFMKANN
jgi:hypothetical protein